MISFGAVFNVASEPWHSFSTMLGFRQSIWKCCMPICTAYFNPFCCLLGSHENRIYIYNRYPVINPELVKQTNVCDGNCYVGLKASTLSLQTTWSDRVNVDICQYLFCKFDHQIWFLQNLILSKCKMRKWEILFYFNSIYARESTRFEHPHLTRP